MSYDIAIVLPPVRESYVAAWAELETLIEVEGPAPPKPVEWPTGDYEQVACGADAFTLEWRRYGEGSFRHHVAGHAGIGAIGTIAIPTNGAFVTVHANERSAEADITELLLAFADNKHVPARFSWRDISGQLA